CCESGPRDWDQPAQRRAGGHIIRRHLTWECERRSFPSSEVEANESKLGPSEEALGSRRCG
ncbi:MAG TPA: hypothetical protein VF905_01580, partial [Nitrospirota bacterium]